MSDTSAGDLAQVARVGRPARWVVGGVALVAVVGLTFVVFSRPRSEMSQSAGDLSQLAAALVAVAGCLRAARRDGPDRLAWAVLASALGIWAAGMALWSWYGLTRNHDYPYPSLADLGFVGYAGPAVAALMLFSRSSRRGASGLRELLDAAVIAGSVLFGSWSTVLGPLYQSGGNGLTRLVGLAYPIVDITMASVVLVLAMRVPPEQRLPWLLLGGGLVLLTLTDSTFVSMTIQGQTGLTGTPLVLGWVGAMTLIASASAIRPRPARPARIRHLTNFQELLPAVALTGAITLAIARALDHVDAFLLGNAVLLLLFFAAQQVLAVRTRVFLADELEVTIARRTAELSSVDARFRSMVESSDDAIISASLPDAVVTSWNAAAERLLGYSSQQMLGGSLDVIVPADKRRESYEVREGISSGDSARRTMETVRIHQDGTLVPVSLTASPIYDGDKVTGFSGILRDITDRLARQREMEFQALHDTLTGLPNRELLTERLDQALHLDIQAGTRTGLMLIDLDRFKEVNDTFGYRCGDDLLRQVGPRLAGVLRAGDTIARLGGDEFGVILPGLHDADAASAVALSLVEALEITFHVEGADLDVEASIGVVVSGEHGQDPTTLLQRGDTALDVAKTLATSMFAYDPALDRHTPSRLALLGDLRRALERGELVLHYQPKVCLGTGNVVGAEALVRWQHPGRSLMFPDEFIPMAEHTALIGPLTRHVLGTALAQARSWIDAGRPLTVAVNLSARNLHDEDFATQVTELLAAHYVPAHLLELEVTESAIMIDPDRAQQTLKQLAGLGVRISIDDFGAGYTSLSQLTTLPVSELKIDKSFVMTMAQDPGNAMIVQSVIDLGHNLGLTLVAEGVETEQSLRALAALNCDIAQGYHICRPVPAAAFDLWCAERTLTAPGPPRSIPQSPPSEETRAADGVRRSSTGVGIGGISGAA